MLLLSSESIAETVRLKRHHESGDGDKPAKISRYHLEKYQFSTQGCWVAVFYDGTDGPEFYIGQVTNVVGADEGVINFMQTCGVHKNVFRWPSVTDVDTVSSKFVFHSDFEVYSTNGRT